VVFPAFWTDNALNLVPGETSTVRVKAPKELALRAPHLVPE
jgi:hypothetical protein